MLGDEAGVVVVHLVVVPDHNPWKRGVDGLQCRVAAILRVPIPVVLERHQLAAHVPAHAIVAGGVFVNVIPQVHREIQILVRHVLEGRVEALLVVLARHERKSHLVHRRAGRRERACTPDRTQLIARLKLIPIPALRFEARHFHVDCVGPRGRCHGRARLHHARHAIVGSNTPLHVDRLAPHASAVQRIRRQPGPQHHTVRTRIARCHAKRER